MNLIERFRPALRDRSGEPALDCEGGSWTFGELDAASDRVARALTNGFGIVKGDRIALYLPSCTEWIVLHLACLKVGAISVPIHLLFHERELSKQVTDAEPRLILTDRERLPRLAPLLPGLPCIEHVVLVDQERQEGTSAWSRLDDGRPVEPVDTAEIGGDDPALMVYTSGTTGTSKGALLTHGNLSWNASTMLHCWRWTARDRQLLALPLFHLHGIAVGLHGWLASGCHTTLLARFEAETVLRAMAAGGSTLFHGVPAMYVRLLEAAEAGAPVPATLRLYVCGSAPLTPATFERFASVFGHRILVRYGMSETALITSNLYGGPGARVPGTVGKPVPGVSVRLADPEGRPVVHGEVGELQVRGPGLMHGYWRRPKETVLAFTRDRWFRTGDLARHDEEGNIVLTGRSKELILCSGANVYPEEVVQCLVEHESVSEAAVVGVPDDRRGESVKAYVVRRDASPTAAELIAFCQQRLAGFKVPRAIEFLDVLPRNVMGKLEPHRLPNRERL